LEEKYLTLSYVWGNLQASDECSQISDEEEDSPATLARAQLPVEDTMTTTRNLGYRYLQVG
jgi:hypothetical protein